MNSQHVSTVRVTTMHKRFDDRARCTKSMYAGWSPQVEKAKAAEAAAKAAAQASAAHERSRKSGGGASAKRRKVSAHAKGDVSDDMELDELLDAEAAATAAEKHQSEPGAELASEEDDEKVTSPQHDSHEDEDNGNVGGAEKEQGGKQGKGKGKKGAGRPGTARGSKGKARAKSTGTEPLGAEIGGSVKSKAQKTKSSVKKRGAGKRNSSAKAKRKREEEEGLQLSADEGEEGGNDQGMHLSAQCKYVFNNMCHAVRTTMHCAVQRA